MAFTITTSKRGTVESSAEKVAAKARAVQATGKDMCFLNVGAPATQAPKAAIAAAMKVEQERRLGYAYSAGLPQLRERIAAMYHDNYGVSVDYGRILVTIGASSAFFIAFDSLFDVGDKVAVPLPCYNAYLDVMKSLGLDIVDFPARPDHHFQPTPEDLEALGPIDGLLLTNPGNPTGAMLKPESLKAVIDWCLKNEVKLICDEIYHGIVYGDVEQETGLKFTDQVVVINSFSKYYSMPGWRLGWMVLPDQIVDSVTSLAHSLFIAAPSPSQYAAIAAMDCTDELDENVARYRRNRDILLQEMPKAGFDRFTPMDGAFYMYAHVKHLHENSMDFCLHMIEQTGVVAAPGLGFDPKHGQHYVRFSYAGPTQEIERACKALQAWTDRD